MVPIDSRSPKTPHDLACPCDSKARFLPYKMFLFLRMNYRRFSYGRRRKISPFSLYESEGVIFIHIPKNAGTFVNGVVYPSFCPDVATEINAHHSVRYLFLLDREKFLKLRKFAILRHPADRLESAFNYLKFGSPFVTDKQFAGRALARFPDFDAFVSNVSSGEFEELMEWIHFQPQWMFISDCDGKLMVDALCTVEHLEDGLRTIGDQFGKRWRAEKTGSGSVGPRSKRTADLISTFYSTDLALWQSVYQEGSGSAFFPRV